MVGARKKLEDSIGLEVVDRVIDVLAEGEACIVLLFIVYFSTYICFPIFLSY